MNLVPLGAAGSVIHVYYSEQLFFWILSLFLIRKAVDTGQRRWWYALGTSLGCGLLSHHTFFILTFQLFLYLLLSDKGRPWLRRKEPYLAGFMALAIFSPAFVWNLHHNMVTFRHAPGQLGRDHSVVRTFLVQFLGGQLGVITPLIFLAVLAALAAAAYRGLKKKNDAWLFLFATSAPLLLYVSCISFGGRVEANWPASAYVSGFIAVSALFYLRRTRKIWHTVYATAALSLALLATLAAHFPRLVDIVYDLPPAKDPTNRLQGWRELGQDVSALRTGMPDSFLCALDYGLAGELGFYTQGQPHAYCLPVSYRQSQYSFSNINREIGRDAIYVKIGRDPVEARVRDLFESVGPPSERVILKGDGPQVRWVFSIYRCKGFKGFFGKLPDKY
jgi:hypothetical protein